MINLLEVPSFDYFFTIFVYFVLACIPLLLVFTFFTNRIIK
ncbi:hypothetical protein [Campylobacter iguaniorum]|nr:hypothetical protein [Campylobacter iguaniorum]